MRVREDVGGGGKLQVVWTCANFKANFFAKGVPEPTVCTPPTSGNPHPQ